MGRTVQKGASTRRDAPARTPEEQEQKMINLAFQLAEKKLRDGTASSQVITHFLQLGTEKAKLEREKLRAETDLAQAKVTAVESATTSDEIYRNALDAMRRYQGAASTIDYDDGDEYYDFDD